MKVAIVGATGAVGREMISILEDRDFPATEYVPFASSRSVGNSVQICGKTYRVQALKKGCFQGVNLAFFDASDAVSKEWVMEAAESGAWVVDHSATYRMDDDIPLVVPEVNGELVRARLEKGNAAKPRDRVVSGPNCTAAPLVMLLKPLHEKYGLKRVVVSTYQSTSGAGTAAMEELSAQTVGMFNQKPVPPKAFAHQIAFNCIPQIGGAKDDGYTSEEHKLILETRKMLGLPGLKITATAVRVPTFSGHGESVNIEFERPVGSLSDVRALFEKQSGVKVLDDLKKNIYPMNVTGENDPVEGATGRDPVLVGRIRKDESVDHGINLWLVSDNLRKGAALNAVQIGELIVEGLR